MDLQEEGANLNRSTSVGELFDDIGGFDRAFETFLIFMLILMKV